MLIFGSGVNFITGVSLNTINVWTLLIICEYILETFNFRCSNIN